MVATSYRLARRRVNDRNRRAEQHKERRKGVSSLILLYLVVAIVLQYSYNGGRVSNTSYGLYKHTVLSYDATTIDSKSVNNFEAI